MFIDFPVNIWHIGLAGYVNTGNPVATLSWQKLNLQNAEL